MPQEKKQIVYQQYNVVKRNGNPTELEAESNIHKVPLLSLRVA